MAVKNIRSGTEKETGQMDEQPATLERDVTPPHGGTVPRADDDQLRAKRMKFHYLSGSRPLDGYTIKRGIGIGGFGEVYFALSDAGKEVALKRIQRNLDIELRGVRQCLNLKHGNLISLWDIRTCEAGESWVIMEYVPGDSLREVIEKYPQGMPREELHLWFESTAAGVAYLHDRGIVHRDLKPGNIFRDEDEQVIKIGDYGLSKFISCSNRDGQTESVGTFHYMAPEIGKGVYGKEIDIYALGIILFEMLTGRVPFEGESSQEIIMKHLTALPPVEGLAEPYRSVIRRALAKDSERRFASVAEMVEQLQQPAGSVAKAAAEVAATSSVVPPIQPMFIGEQTHYIGDDEIRFGEVRQVVDAEISHTSRRPESPLDGMAAAAANPAMPAARKLPDEPIARAVHSGWHNVVDWWYNANISTPVKIIILIGVIFLLLANSAWIIPAAFALGFLYLMYYLVRSWTTPSIPRRSRRRKVSKAELAGSVRAHLGGRPAIDRATELTGSLLAAAFACLVLGLLALAVGGSQIDSSSQQWAFYSWLVITGAVGSWSILLVNKFWEHRDDEASVKRFLMVSVGLMTGFVGFFADQFLHLNWAGQVHYHGLEMSPLHPAFFVSASAPTLWGYLVFFAGLFFILRWWRLADPLRKTRLSMWSVGLGLIWAVIIGQLFHFPLPWSAMLAVTISVSTQLGAPWLSPPRREQIYRGQTA